MDLKKIGAQLTGGLMLLAFGGAVNFNGWKWEIDAIAATRRTDLREFTRTSAVTRERRSSDVSR